MWRHLMRLRSPESKIQSGSRVEKGSVSESNKKGNYDVQCSRPPGLQLLEMVKHKKKTLCPLFLPRLLQKSPQRSLAATARIFAAQFTTLSLSLSLCFACALSPFLSYTRHEQEREERETSPAHSHSKCCSFWCGHLAGQQHLWKNLALIFVILKIAISFTR